MALHGSIHEFNLGSTDSWKDYTERLGQYFLANDVDAEAKKKAILLTVIGTPTYSLLKSLLSPTLPSDKTYDQLIDTLKKHLSPEPIVIAERYKFYESKQVRGESLIQYLAKLRKKAEHCKFEQFLEEALRDKFVCGLESGTIRKALLAKKDLTLTTAVEIAVSCEMATEESFVISKKEVKEEAFKMTDSKNNKPSSSKRKCYRCNDPSHLANRCRFKEGICYKCKMRGHIAVACRNSNKQGIRSRSDGQTYNNRMSPAGKRK